MESAADGDWGGSSNKEDGEGRPGEEEEEERECIKLVWMGEDTADDDDVRAAVAE